jgi:F0F1-type ATP synthase assembly protein I
MTQRDDSGKGMQFLATAAWFTGMGWTIAISTVLGVLAGNWLDGRTGTHPLFLLIGLILGLALGLYSAGRMLVRFLAESDRQS